MALLSGQPVVTAVTDTYMTGAAQFVRDNFLLFFSASCSERSWRRQGRLPPLPNSWLSCWGRSLPSWASFSPAQCWSMAVSPTSGGGVQPVSHCPLPVQEGQPAPLSAARRDCRRLLHLCLQLSRHAQSGQCDPHHLSGDQHHGGPSGGRDDRNCCHAHGVCLLPVGGKSGPGPGGLLCEDEATTQSLVKAASMVRLPSRISSPSCPLCSS